jgi:hypothetical protein
VNFTDYSLLLDRVAATTPMLEPNERASAERVIAICHELAPRAREAGRIKIEPGDLELKRELGRHMETLGRRGSLALPAATLARAALADLSGDARSFGALCAECEAKLALFGG